MFGSVAPDVNALRTCRLLRLSLFLLVRMKVTFLAKIALLKIQLTVAEIFPRLSSRTVIATVLSPKKVMRYIIENTLVSIPVESNAEE